MESSLISKENSMEMFVICIIKFTIWWLSLGKMLC
jgi:hypothetical protein